MVYLFILIGELFSQYGFCQSSSLSPSSGPRWIRRNVNTNSLLQVNHLIGNVNSYYLYRLPCCRTCSPTTTPTAPTRSPSPTATTARRALGELDMLTGVYHSPRAACTSPGTSSSWPSSSPASSWSPATPPSSTPSGGPLTTWSSWQTGYI